MTTTITRALQLWSGIGLYFVGSLGGVALVKWLNYYYNFHKWMIFAVLSRSTWILSLAFHFGVLHFTNHGATTALTAMLLLPSRKQLTMYLWIALGFSAVEWINSWSMSVLPGSLYLLLKGSDVGWSMCLSCVLLHKKYSPVKHVAAAFIMGGIGLVFVLDLYDYDNAATSATRSSSIAGGTISVAEASLLCVGGAFVNALCSVLTEALLKQSLQEEQDRQLLHVQQQQQEEQSATTITAACPPPTPPPPSKLMLSNAYSMWTSFFSFSFLIIPVVVVGSSDSGSHDGGGDRGDDSATGNNTVTNNDNTLLRLQDITISNATTTTTMIGLGIAICLALLTISRFLERLSKYFICVHDSAVTFSIVQAARRWSGIYIVGCAFHESFSTAMLVGSCLSGFGFVLYAWNTGSSSNHATTMGASDDDTGRNHGHSRAVYEKVATTDTTGNEVGADDKEEIEMASASS